MSRFLVIWINKRKQIAKKACIYILFNSQISSYQFLNDILESAYEG